MNRRYYLRKFLVVLLSLICSFSWAATNHNVKITAANINVNTDKTQLIFTLTGPAKYKVTTLTKPDRVAIDIANVKLDTSLSALDLSNSPILNIREGYPSTHQLHIVLELHKKLALHTQMQKEKLIIELIGKNNIKDKTVTAAPQANQWAEEDLPKDGTAVTAKDDTTAATTTATKSDIPVETAETEANPTTTTPVTTKPTPAAAITAVPKTVPTPVVATKSNLAKPEPTSITNSPITESLPPVNNSTPVTSVANMKGKRAIIVVIDPGHGGKDPGTMGSMGVQEKDVVLGISKQMEDILNKEEGFRAVLTRNADYFIPLRGRLNIARKDRGDIFVAIHADAYINSYASGSSVFTLSAHGASSEAARWLAERENTSELGGVNLRDKSNTLRSVLIDLSQTATIASSMQSGKSVLRHLNQIGKLHRGFVEQAPFMVLKNPDIPSMLVETGFLSNPMEEQRLRDPYYQRKIAAAIVDGIKDYFYNNPPPGTLVASLKQNKSFF